MQLKTTYHQLNELTRAGFITQLLKKAALVAEEDLKYKRIEIKYELVATYAHILTIDTNSLLSAIVAYIRKK